MRITKSLFAFSCSGLLACTAKPAAPVSTTDAALSALEAIYVAKNTSAVDTYFDRHFIRHDPKASADGTVAFKADLSSVVPSVSWKSFRAFAQDDLVVVHDEYDGPQSGERTVSFDLFRFAAGKIVEHWTCTQPDPGTYASGHTMVDGPTTIDPAADTAASEDVVVTPNLGFVPVVIIGGQFSRLADFLQPAFAQHDPLLADGLMGLGAGFAQPPLSTLRVLSLPESLGESNYVFTRSKGTMTWDAMKSGSPNNPTVTCDLFRVDGGKIAEHWDVIQLDPNSTDINNLAPNGAGHTLWD
jgi:predicted SnoaL-like aldol condensation-catalyzing enzyme